MRQKLARHRSVKMIGQRHDGQVDAVEQVRKFRAPMGETVAPSELLGARSINVDDECRSDLWHSAHRRKMVALRYWTCADNSNEQSIGHRRASPVWAWRSTET